MDEKKVRETIVTFQGQLGWLKCIDDKEWEESRRCCIEYFETAIEALEKQLPKKVVVRSLVKDNGIVVGFIGKCPSCGEIIDGTTLTCDCGQRLDWSE